MSATRLELSAPSAADPASLPDGDSPNLELVPASVEEQVHCTLLNAASWAGPLGIEAYLQREERLAQTQLTKDGGLTVWVLVDKNDTKNPRTILAACESIRKRALIASKETNEVKDTWASGICSVYCRSEYRGKGYAVRMMAELRKRLAHWQQEDSRAEFTVLYSDIGKKFYAKNGWIPYASSHVSLSPGAPFASSNIRLLRSSDILDLCRKDEQLLRNMLSDFSAQQHDFRVAFVPEADIMAWHHVREEFLASKLLNREATFKGAMVESDSGSAWCIWSRMFSKNKQENVMYILRIVVEGEDFTGRSIDQAHVASLKACISAAQEEAKSWSMNSVNIWNPSPTVLAACKEIDPDLKLVDREEESVAALNWYGEHPGLDKVEWVANEKFGWC